MEERKEDLQEKMTVEDTEETPAQDAVADDADNAENDADEADEANADEVSESEEEQDGPGDKADKKFFKKKAKADKKQDALKEKVDELEDKVKRQMAEFDNFRKRTEKEKAAMFETGAKSVIEKILPVVDNFERGLATIPEEDKGSGFANGMEMIYRQLMTELEKMDVKPIAAVGEEFNPEFHNAVMQVESEEYESGVVAQELLKGYTYRDTVVRHSMVAVVS
ncbi:MAG: nucleotide exchange factor GrpE [Lachnospiraceae bacterium]|nr:nucleotide exchange factor GrpE [Lachnospiraceae bacterium]